LLRGRGSQRAECKLHNYRLTQCFAQDM